MHAARDIVPPTEVYEITAPETTPPWLRLESPGGDWARLDVLQARIERPEVEEIIQEDNPEIRHPKDLAGNSRWFIDELEPTAAAQQYAKAHRIFRDKERFTVYGHKKKYGVWMGMRLRRKDTVRKLLLAVTIVHRGHTVWLYDLVAQKPDRVLTLWELVTGEWFIAGGHRGFYDIPFDERDSPQHALIPSSSMYFKGEKGQQLYPMSESQWENGEWPPEDLGGPPRKMYGMEDMAREKKNPVAADADEPALICMGRDIVLELSDCDDIELPRRWGMLHDPSGTFWPKCSLLFTHFHQGKTRDDSDEGVGYFGKRANVRRGCADEIPPNDLRHGWREVGIVTQVFYERAGKHEGRYRHKFNDPRGWMWLVALFKRKTAKTPPVLFEYNHGGVVALRLELPDGCMVDDRGIALP